MILSAIGKFQTSSPYFEEVIHSQRFSTQACHCKWATKRKHSDCKYSSSLVGQILEADFRGRANLKRNFGSTLSSPTLLSSSSHCFGSQQYFFKFSIFEYSVFFRIFSIYFNFLTQPFRSSPVFSQQKEAMNISNSLMIKSEMGLKYK